MAHLILNGGGLGGAAMRVGAFLVASCEPGSGDVCRALSTIADRLGFPKSTAVRAVAALERSGILGATDRRSGNTRIRVICPGTRAGDLTVLRGRESASGIRSGSEMASASGSRSAPSKGREIASGSAPTGSGFAPLVQYQNGTSLPPRTADGTEPDAPTLPEGEGGGGVSPGEIQTRTQSTTGAALLGMLPEGDVSDRVRNAADRFAALGGTAEEWRDLVGGSFADCSDARGAALGLLAGRAAKWGREREKEVLAAPRAAPAPTDPSALAEALTKLGATSQEHIDAAARAAAAAGATLETVEELEKRAREQAKTGDGVGLLLDWMQTPGRWDAILGADRVDYLAALNGSGRRRAIDTDQMYGG